jgi:hypothetical protein
MTLRATTVLRKGSNENCDSKPAEATITGWLSKIGLIHDDVLM